ncbi:hypothetical protein L4D21_27205 [Photobacterium profundum]|uniref:DUF6602 domain-containing protein n=1 Tax=Photobacterium profundum TaxID=74109 RepID=UPI003D097999
MSSDIFQSLILQHIDELKNSYIRSKDVFTDSYSGKLIHPGEYGYYREEAVKKLLHLSIPRNFGITSGFIITSNNRISTQCDIIIYDRESCPKLINEDHVEFIPVECVVAVGEVKSSIKTNSQMLEILEKLAFIKQLRRDVETKSNRQRQDQDPLFGRFGAIYSFLLCLDFPKFPDGGFDYCPSPLKMFRHNFIVGLNTGHCCYRCENIYNYSYPVTDGIAHEQIFKELNNDKIPLNLGLFLTSLFNHCKNAKLPEFDPVFYISNNIAE